jgi:hypothetical protein
MAHKQLMSCSVFVLRCSNWAEKEHWENTIWSPHWYKHWVSTGYFYPQHSPEKNHLLEDKDIYKHAKLWIKLARIQHSRPIKSSRLQNKLDEEEYWLERRGLICKTDEAA